MAHSDDGVAQTAEQQSRVTIAFLTLAWLFVLLRIWTRTYVIANFGWDDAAMILASMIFTVYCAGILYIDMHGGGTHIYNVSQLQLLAKWVIITETTYLMTIMTLKISLGIFFARIVIKPWQVGLIYLNVSVNIFSSTAAFFFCLFRCGPDIGNYVLMQVADKCTTRTLNRFIAYQQAAVTTLTDIVFVTLPVLILWNSNMSKRSKISVGFILCLAALGVVCSILRFRYVDGLTNTDDFFWAAVQIATWSTIECGASIIAGCLATLRPLIKHIASAVRHASTFNSCTPSGTRSYGWSARSAREDNLPPFNSTLSDTKAGSSGNRSIRQPMGESTMMEFLAQPGRDVIALNGEKGDRRTSTDPILSQQTAEERACTPWPVVARDRSKRQTMHAIRTLRDGAASDGRTAR